MDHGMNSMAMSPSTSSSSTSTSTSSSSSNMHMMMKKKMMMHMSFYWDDKAEILFKGWPGSTRPEMYYIALVLVFVLAFAVELISHRRVIVEDRGGSGRVVAGLIRTIVYAFRVGFAYLVMLAVMSFNGGVFVAAVGGHVLGYFLFGSNVFGGKVSSGRTSDDFSCNC